MGCFVNSFFDSRQVGEFSLQYLSLAMRNPPVELEKSWRARPEATKLHTWLDYTAYFHELRHYHDLVGTVCGFHIFLETTYLVDAFLESLRRLSQRKLLLPILQFAPDTEAARIYSGYKEFLKVVMGDLPIEIEDTYTDIYPSRTFTSLLPPLRTTYFLVPMWRRNPETGLEEYRLVALGVRALMEHIATEMQIFLAALAVGEDAEDTPTGEDVFRRSHFLWSDLVRADFLPYIVCRIFATYRLHVLEPDKKIDMPRFVKVTPRLGEIAPFAQAALDLGGYVPIADPIQNYTWEFEHPGLIFGHLMDAWGKTERRADLLTSVNNATIEVMKKSYTDFLTRYAENLQSKPYTLVPPHLSPMNAKSQLIAKLREDAFELHRTLIKSKVEDLWSWFTPHRYLELTGQLPAPPIQSVPGMGVHTFEKEKRVRFLMWNFLLSFIEGIAESGNFVCPIKSRAPVVGSSVFFPDPRTPGKQTNCTPFIDQNQCGHFDGKFLATQPPCPFVDLIEELTSQVGLEFDFRRQAHGAANI
jgi:hypothetical protein